MIARAGTGLVLVHLLALRVGADERASATLTLTAPTMGPTLLTPVTQGATTWSWTLTLPANGTQVTITTVDSAGVTRDEMFLVTALPSPPPALRPVTVSWGWSGDGSTFQVERCASPCGAMAPVVSLPITDRQWVDTTVQAGTSYCYRLAVVTGTTRGPYSDTLCSP